NYMNHLFKEGILMRIAVAIDGSDNALRAAEYAIMLVTHFPNAEMEIIYVTDYSKIRDERLLTQSPERLTLQRKQNIQPVMDLANDSGLEPKVMMLKGNPSQQIIKYVNNENIDQLIMGSRGLNTFQEMMIGSVSHKTMKHVQCPVTIVK